MLLAKHRLDVAAVAAAVWRGAHAHVGRLVSTIGVAWMASLRPESACFGGLAVMVVFALMTPK